MKSLFPEFFSPTEEDFKKYWDTGIISLDTNVLLNAYRYTEETRSKLFEILDKIDDRLWLTNHVVYEYLSNRPNVILDQMSQLTNLEQMIADLKKSSEILMKKNLNFRHHPAIDKKVILASISESLNTILEDIKTKMDDYPYSLDADSVLDYYLIKFKDRISEPYTIKEIDDIKKEGKVRYDRKIPPGFKDETKTDKNKYGDYIIWRQLLDKGKEAGLPIIFVTDDDKEDWWRKGKGRTLGQREELTKEMAEESSVPFYMYSVDRFMKYAKDYLKVEVTDDQIDEAEQLRKETILHTDQGRKLSMWDAAIQGLSAWDVVQHNYDIDAIERAKKELKILTPEMLDHIKMQSMKQEMEKLAYQNMRSLAGIPNAKELMERLKRESENNSKDSETDNET